MIRKTTASILLLMLASTALARPMVGAEDLVAETRIELDGLHRQVGFVTEPRLRLMMENRILRVEGLLNQVDRALDGKEIISADKALADVESQRYDNDKLAVISNLSDSGRFTSREIARIVGSCAFDSSKVEALIALHPTAVDPDRYGVALDTLEFTSSRNRATLALGLD